jgi:hypothetical protein
VTALPPDHDLTKLVPAFRERVEELVRRMNALKHDAIVWEGWRSFARAEQLHRLGKGIALSMHCYGIGADIISKSMLWSPGGVWWRALGKEAKGLGLTWGGDFLDHNGEPAPDFDHVQAVPVSDEHYVRHATPAQIEALVLERLPSMDEATKPTVRERVTGKIVVPGPDPAQPPLIPRGRGKA